MNSENEKLREALQSCLKMLELEIMPSDESQEAISKARDALSQQPSPQPEQVKAFEALQPAVAYLSRSPSEAIHSGSALHKLMVAALTAQGGE